MVEKKQQVDLRTDLFSDLSQKIINDLNCSIRPSYTNDINLVKILKSSVKAELLLYRRKIYSPNPFVRGPKLQPLNIARKTHSQTPSLNSDIYQTVFTTSAKKSFLLFYEKKSQNKELEFYVKNEAKVEIGDRVEAGSQPLPIINPRNRKILRTIPDFKEGNRLISDREEVGRAMDHSNFSKLPCLKFELLGSADSVLTQWPYYVRQKTSAGNSNSEDLYSSRNNVIAHFDGKNSLIKFIVLNKESGVAQDSAFQLKPFDIYKMHKSDQVISYNSHLNQIIISNRCKVRILTNFGWAESGGLKAGITAKEIKVPEGDNLVFEKDKFGYSSLIRKYFLTGRGVVNVFDDLDDFSRIDSVIKFGRPDQDGEPFERFKQVMSSDERYLAIIEYNRFRSWRVSLVDLGKSRLIFKHEAKQGDGFIIKKDVEIVELKVLNKNGKSLLLCGIVDSLFNRYTAVILPGEVGFVYYHKVDQQGVLVESSIIPGNYSSSIVDFYFK